jgi:hypothetical protein
MIAFTPGGYHPKFLVIKNTAAAYFEKSLEIVSSIEKLCYI